MQAESDSAAGAIWRHLNEHGEITLSKLKQGTKLPDQCLFTGIGWLAREEQLNFTTESVRVCLREHQPRDCLKRSAHAGVRFSSGRGLGDIQTGGALCWHE
jgi:hypothetical protein